MRQQYQAPLILHFRVLDPPIILRGCLLSTMLCYFAKTTDSTLRDPTATKVQSTAELPSLSGLDRCSSSRECFSIALFGPWSEPGWRLIRDSQPSKASKGCVYNRDGSRTGSIFVHPSTLLPIVGLLFPQFPLHPYLNDNVGRISPLNNRD